MKTFFILAALLSTTLDAQTVRITDKPDGLVHGTLYVPIVAADPVQRIEFFINGVKYSQGVGRNLTVQVNVGQYIRRLRMRAVGYDAQGNVAGEDEMVVNDPRPPVRVRLQAPREVPASGTLSLSANVIKPSDMSVATVDFYVGEEKVGSASVPPYAASVDVKEAPNAVYARVVAHGSNGAEANDVVFFGRQPSDQIDVTVQQIPMSVASGSGAVRTDQ
ncbi:MAG TPA: Ig-like domain-containing protein, partial [Thermoanaerobaculia bacterium]|nr:Ig-like domain-containing protein [Thermoanaerobaculia bacterium]